MALTVFIFTIVIGRYLPWNGIKIFCTKVLYPILFDLFFLSLMYSTIAIMTCSDGLEDIIFPDHTSCFHVNRIWYLGSFIFCNLYLGSLLYKMSLTKEVFAVRFRFQTSFASIMTATRTGTSRNLMLVVFSFAFSNRFAVLYYPYLDTK